MNTISRRGIGFLAGIAALTALLAAAGALALADTDGGSDAEAGSQSGAIYPLTIQPNGGTGDPVQWKVLKGNSIELPVTRFQPSDASEGYLAGYSKTSGGSADYAPGQRIAMTGDTTLWAVWASPESHTNVDRDADAPSSGSVSEVYSYSPITGGKNRMGDSSMWILGAEALANGYDVVVDQKPGWMTATVTSREVSFTGSPTGAGVYYVQVHIENASSHAYYVWWTVSVASATDSAHRLTFSAGDGKGSYSVAPGVEGSCEVLPSGGFTKDGYTLAAWSTPISGQTVYYPLSAVYTFTDEDAVMTAYYMPDTGVMVFDANGGVSENGAQAYLVQSGGVVTLPSAGYSMPGCTFCGWRYANEPDGPVYAPGFLMQISEATPSNTMSAVWTDGAVHTVRFDPNGGTHRGPASVTVPSGAKAALPTVGLTLEGKVLSGWNTKADGSGTAIALGNSVTASSDTAVYAVWNASSSESGWYLVTFVMNGGAGSAPAQRVPKGSCAAAPAVPTMDNYVFNGWQRLGYTGTWDFSAPVTSDMTLCATWQRALTVTVDGLSVGVTLDSGRMGKSIDWGDGSEPSAFSRTATKTMKAGASGILTVTLTDGTEVTAHWAVGSGIAEEHTVTIVGEDGKTVATYTAKDGSALSKSAVLKALAKDGKTVTLYTDRGCTHQYGWGKVAADTTLYAAWEDRDGGSAGASEALAIGLAAGAVVSILAFAYYRTPYLAALAAVLGAGAGLLAFGVI